MPDGMCKREKSMWYQICHPDTRAAFTKFAKKPLRLALVKIANRYPELTKESLNNSNSHLLYDMMQEFMSHLGSNPTRDEMIEAAMKIGIIEYDHDIYYRQYVDRFLKELVDLVVTGRWRFDSGTPSDGPYSHCWKGEDIIKRHINARPVKGGATILVTAKKRE